ncbi:MAG: (d)CMP kinase [Thiofilum sp.]|uniref:(d)CMP kinase n=1 Tax=Thiofilum sp. TaxID=2212733 RepID=UPI0025EDCC08|nr:(d)CMP kinase [Thiofilum sp.]MBK8454353.1 (d)CMP kinase [Thiofilum sp.]
MHKPNLDAPVIAIDGPAGVGKGTLAHQLAADLGWGFLDSGAIYRVAALYALRHAIPLDNEEALVEAIRTLDINCQHALILLNGEDVSEAIRTEECASATSKIAALPKVREALLALQQSFQQLPGLVADGRDMGTVVFAHAPLKLFLTASAEVRAERRLKQHQAQGNQADFAQLVKDINERDYRDANRAVAPLKAADDARVIDTSTLSVAEVKALVVAMLKERGYL